MAAEEVNEAVCALGGTSPAVPQPVYTPEESLAPGRSLKWLGVVIVLALLAGGAYVAWQQGALDFLSRQTRRLAQPSPPLQTPDSAENVPSGTLPLRLRIRLKPHPKLRLPNPRLSLRRRLRLLRFRLWRLRPPPRLPYPAAG